MNACFNEYGKFILVSGGADGASKVAEATALEIGIPVISFRPVQISSDEYGIDEWRLYRGQGEVIRFGLGFADFKGAAFFRSWLMADRADEGFAYWDGYSGGTRTEIALFEDRGTPCAVVNLRYEKGSAAA